MPTETLTRFPAGHTPVRTPGADRPTPRGTPSRATGLEWLDLLRITAILAVVVVHAISTATRSAGTGAHSASWWAADLINTACLWCVPVFVMVSGALLLDPERRMPGGAFLRKRAVRIGIPLAFWIAAYLIFERQFYGENVTFTSAWKGIANGDPYLQLYFLFIVAGLTALTPVLRRLIRHSSRRELWWLTAGALVFGLAEHAFRELGGGGGFNAATRFLPYVGYYLAGYTLRTARLPDNAGRLAAAAAIVGWLATAFGSGALASRYGWTSNGYFLYDYLSPTVMLTSLGLFVVVRGWRPRRVSAGQMRAIGGATYGVFLIHPLLLFPLMRRLQLPDGSDISRTVLWAIPVAVTVCIASTAICLIVERIPYLRRLIS